jgi:hypothetical protein
MRDRTPKKKKKDNHGKLKMYRSGKSFLEKLQNSKLKNELDKYDYKNNNIL